VTMADPRSPASLATGADEPVRWLDEDEQRTWRKLASIMLQLPAALDAELQRDADLTHFAYFVLAMLSEAPGRALRMSALAARSSSSPSRLSHTVARLEARGLVRRRRAFEDGRGQIAELTDEGFEYLTSAAPGHVAEVRRLVFDVVPRSMLADLDRISTLILTRLDPDGARSNALPDEQPVD
jgi:DNA-binding MarR family transcriptional regulator